MDCTSVALRPCISSADWSRPYDLAGRRRTRLVPFMSATLSIGTSYEKRFELTMRATSTRCTAAGSLLILIEVRFKT